jgi:membrane-associated phospholipid phosphatase
MDRLAKVVSYILHPLWMPLITLVWVLREDPFLFVQGDVFIFLFIILLINSLAPGLSIFIMYKRGMISSLEVEKRKERFVPFLLVMLYYSLSYMVLRTKQTPIPNEIYSLLFALIVSLAISMLISFKYKISMHTMAQGALFGVFFALGVKHALQFHLLLMCIALMGALVAWARLRMKVHTPSQVLTGWLLGVSIHFFIVVLGVWL